MRAEARPNSHVGHLIESDMKFAFAVCLALTAPVAAFAQMPGRVRAVQFTGASAAGALCASLLKEWQSAEAQGRLDFAVEVVSAGTGESALMTARIWTGSPHAVGRINFTGHSNINESTIRRAMTIHERELLDVGQLRRSLLRIFVSLNLGGFAKPLLALERPVLPGQEWLSGFAISPMLSPRGMLTHYGRTHLAHTVGATLNGPVLETLGVPVTADGDLQAEPLLCKPPTPRLLWLRRGAAAAIDIALAALIP